MQPCKIHLWEADHPKFKGHVTPNKAEYQKSVSLIFRYCLGVSQFTISLLISPYWWRDRLWNRPFSKLLDLRQFDLGLIADHTVYCSLSLTDLYLRNKFSWNREKVSWMDGWMDTENRSNQRSRPKQYLTTNTMKVKVSRRQLSDKRWVISTLLTSDSKLSVFCADGLTREMRFCRFLSMSPVLSRNVSSSLS